MSNGKENELNFSEIIGKTPVFNRNGYCERACPFLQVDKESSPAENKAKCMKLEIDLVFWDQFVAQCQLS